VRETSSKRSERNRFSLNKSSTEKLHALPEHITIQQRVSLIAYLNWDCEDIESACEDCIGAYIEKSEKQHLKQLKNDFSNIDELVNCRECETVIEICCNCNDVKCNHRIASRE